MEKVVIEFLAGGSFIDNAWDGRFTAEKGDHKTVTPSLAMRLVATKVAKTVLDENGDPVIETVLPKL
ncbi:hypothetical protein ACK14O_14325 [Vibrio harveyi]|uniref:hypothetical protein n=1 Tax=Vibrio harveyi TaxID=669 RepID=UPI00390ADAB4